jgi:hypothetical protein
MMRCPPALLALTLTALAASLGGCSNFDMDKLDIFGLNDKKPLPGERKALFPQGVPGAPQGVPPELVKGYQPPVQAAVATPEPIKPAVAEKPKPAKPRVARRPTRIDVQPEAAQQQQQQEQRQQQQQQAQPQQQQPQQQSGGNAPWPSSSAQQQQPQQSSPWPDAPQSGTFQR